MNRSWRWVVAMGVALLVAAVPFVVRAFPVPRDATAAPTAAALLERMRQSWSRPYSGYAETTGSLALPASDQLDAVSTLLSGRTEIRVWWRSSDDWRADTISSAGEHSTRTTPHDVSVWDYEDNRVVLTTADFPGTVRLPQDSDTLPPQLGARLLGEASPDEVSMLPSRRVAGRVADGLRMQPSDPLTSIGRVDVWADRASGIPVLVEVFGRAGGGAETGAADTAAMSSTFLDFTDVAPTAQDVAFEPPPGSRVRFSLRPDLVRQISRTRGPQPPARLLGFERTVPLSSLGGVAQYGHGVTQLAVGQLPDRVAGSLRDQLSGASGATRLPEGLTVTVGPVGLLLTNRDAAGRTWLVAGTVTSAGLTRAASELAAAP